MNRLDVPKILFYVVSITGLLGLAFAFGIYSAAKKTAVYEAVRVLKNRIEGSVNLVFQEASTLTKTRPKHFLQPLRYNGEGVTVNEVTGGEEELVLMAGFFNNDNEIRLIRRNGRIVNRWSARPSSMCLHDAIKLYSSPMKPHATTAGVR